MWRLTSPAQDDQPPALLLRLLTADPALVVTRREVVAGSAAALATIRAGSPVVEWYGVNERRVDAVVSTGDDQYRIVYFTDDGRTIDELALFRRPPPFDGVDGGRIVVVNGPSGAGKSSLLAALAAGTAVPWVVFDEPVMGSVDQSYLIWRDLAPRLHRGFLHAIAALARQGNLVAVSAAGHPPADIDAAFDGVAVVRIGLDCDVPTLQQRERGREGRWGGLVEASLGVHDGWCYDARFDTTTSSAETIAAAVRRLVDAVT